MWERGKTDNVRVVKIRGGALGGRTVSGRTLSAVIIAVGLGAAAPAAASAASAPFQIGTFPELSTNIELTSVDVDAAGTAYVAWPDLNKNVVDYCVLPDGASACAESGALSPVLEPGANPQSQPSVPSLAPFGHVVEVMVNGGTVSIIAGTTGPADEATPGTGGWLQETEMWQAPDGTGNFTLVNNGNSVAYPQPRVQNPEPGYSNYVEPSYFNDGVVVPGSGELGEFDFSPDGPPSFEAFPQTNPPACSELSHPPCAFATLEPSSNPDPVSNYSYLVDRQIASESGPNPGILGIDLTFDATGPFSCTPPGLGPNGTHLSDVYVYGSGLQSATNDYNISAGQPNSAWKVAATQIPDECPAGVSAIAGGPSGFGLFEAASSSGTSVLRYRPFDSASASFDKPAVTVDPYTSASTIGLSQDGAGNIYATGFVQQQGAGSPNAAAASGAPLALFYSGDGGKTWQGPGPLESTVQPGFQRSESAVGSDGKGWMVITAAGSVYALEFSAADAASSFSAGVSAPPPVTNGSVTVPLSCYAVPCTVTTTLSGAVARAARFGLAASAVLGTGSVQITQHGVQNVKIRLSAAGAAALEASGGKLPVSLNESTALGPYSEHKTVPLMLTEVVPVVSRLKISPSSLTAASSGASVASTRTGATVSYTDTLAAKTGFVVAERKPGVLSKGVCGKPPRTVSGHPRSCWRWVSVGSFSHADKAGANKFHFTGRVSGRQLAAGSYRLEATPALGGTTGKTVWVSFTVRKS